MGIFESIERLQKKPRRYREKLLYVFLAVSMFAVIAMWLMFGAITGAGRVKEEAGNLPANVGYSPFSIIKSDFSLFLEKTKEGVLEMRKGFGR